MYNVAASQSLAADRNVAHRTSRIKRHPSPKNDRGLPKVEMLAPYLQSHSAGINGLHNSVLLA